MSDLLTQPAVELLALLRAKKLSVLELAEMHLERIEELNPELNALVDFDPEEIRREAVVLDGSTAAR